MSHKFLEILDCVDQLLRCLEYLGCATDHFHAGGCDLCSCWGLYVWHWWWRPHATIPRSATGACRAHGPPVTRQMRAKGVKGVGGLLMLMTVPSHTSLPSREARGDLALRFHLVPELHFTLSLMVVSLSSFFWAAMLMMLIMYLVALYFTIVRS